MVIVLSTGCPPVGNKSEYWLPTIISFVGFNNDPCYLVINEDQTPKTDCQS